MGLGSRMHSNWLDTPALKSANAASSPLWLRFGSRASLSVAIIFLLISLFLNFDLVRTSTVLGVSIVVAFALAISLTSCSLAHLRCTHRETDQAFRDTDREFFAIFQNVIDGILIVDDDGDCLDANTAAVAILRVSLNELVGQNIGRFLPDHNTFKQRWRTFLRSKNHRGRARLIAGDGTTLFVDLTAAANYVPSRHVLILCDVTERTLAELALSKSEERFQHMANNIQEIFWMMDAVTQEITYVNRAYGTITGYSVDSLKENPFSYRDLIHPEDRIRVLSRLEDLGRFRTLDEEFRFVRADGEVRWVWAKGFPVQADAETRWLVGTTQDITSRKQAEMKITEQLDAVEAARAEAEALRRSTLALSQNLAMDSVLDTLLQCISDLIPFDKATVLFVEDGADLMVAREAPQISPRRIGLTLNFSQNIFLQRILFEKKSLLLPDVAQQVEWRNVHPLDHLQSWLGIPLIAGDRVLGILSLGSNVPGLFTTEHLRLAKSLAVPAAVAIQNARTHERAEIYATELELRLEELREAQKALQQASGESSN